jgi:ribose transport system ATP-binding protein
MVGRELAEEYPHHSLRKKEPVLKLENIYCGILKDINLELHKGEVLGLGGLAGAGRTELARVIFGADNKESGRIFLEGKEIIISSPKTAIDNGIALLTEDRNRYALFMDMDISQNITISDLHKLAPGLFIDKKREKKDSQYFFDLLKIKAPSVETNVETLSGGNRQKVVLARWLLTNAKVIIFDEPTAGIDIGVKYEIYNLISKLADDGTGIIVISSDLPELIGISDRIIVLCGGRISGTLEKSDFSQEKILTLATEFQQKN